MRHDLAVVRRQLVIGRFGVGAIGQMVVEHTEIFHLADPAGVIGVKVPRHQDLVDGFEHPAEGRGIDHVAQRFAHKQFFGGMQAHPFHAFKDARGLFLGVAVIGGFCVVAAHPGIVAEGPLAADDL
jgi:hypothetical protein